MKRIVRADVAGVRKLSVEIDQAGRKGTDHPGDLKQQGVEAAIDELRRGSAIVVRQRDGEQVASRNQGKASLVE